MGAEGSLPRLAVNALELAHGLAPCQPHRQENTPTSGHPNVPPPPPTCAPLACSLNPGVDRLAFSVVWDMNEEGNIE